ncbi:MAG TPA: Rrf2 family transcriptional regulator [Opitutaceae bacterium]|nr:Rrf2 family transcriptional regulator [Opitutaceae bacterium]
MSTNARFAVGVHVLIYLAAKPEEPVTSADIACSVNTNPVVIRRLLSTLREAKIVAAQKGAVGGFTLAMDPQKLSLLAIYRAVEPAQALAFPRAEANHHCPIGAKVHAVLEGVFSQAQSALERELDRVTLGDMLHKVKHICPRAAG